VSKQQLVLTETVLYFDLIFDCNTFEDGNPSIRLALKLYFLTEYVGIPLSLFHLTLLNIHFNTLRISAIRNVYNS